MFLTRVHAPEFHMAVFTRRREELAVGAEHHSSNNTAFPEMDQLLSVAGVPEPDGAVRASRRNALTVRTEGNPGDGPHVPSQGQENARGGRVPNQDLARVVRVPLLECRSGSLDPLAALSRTDALPIRTPCDAANRCGMAPHGKQLAACRCIPDLGR